ncbi:Sulfatase-modifying factor 2 [Phytophthora nicotianae]|uniref:Sulfatase-modifying factor 2 n=1 Tax=Phytophthora nicotianae TaxID=4792 RepID=A0A0W8DJR9_PHYNI|nr:Sulfatase-modifying factor 2 [Phytophthora nicotianae]
MSVLVPQPNEEVLEALDARYFTESFDPVAHMLENLPEIKDELNVFMRTEISAVDVAKDVILTKLQDDVRANYNALIQGMKVVQDVDLDLVRAQIHVKNGRRLLATAKHDLIMRYDVAEYLLVWTVPGY